jgi:hypothetical protein
LQDSKKALMPAKIPGTSVVDALKRESQVINLVDFVGLRCKAELEENTNRYFIAGRDHVNTEDCQKASNASLDECICSKLKEVEIEIHRPIANK